MNVTGAELARLLGVSRQSVHAAKKAGRIVPSGRNEKGHPLYDADDARAFFAADIGQVTRPGCMAGGRPSKKAIPGEIEVDDRAAVVDDIELAASEARQWLATASPAEITARRATTMARMGELAARHRAYRSRTGCWPTSWPSWQEYSNLEVLLMELSGIRTDAVPP